jgi:DNA polymerase-3 subunit beta
MEIRIKQSNFLEALKWTHGIAERKSAMPVLSNVLLKAENTGLVVMSTDLELSMRIHTPCKVHEKGSVLVNAKGILDIVRESPQKEIKLVGKKESVEVTSGKSEFKVLGMPTNEFPAFPDEKDYNLIPFSGSQLLEMIERTAYSVSTDESRYALNGVYLERQGSDKKTLLRMVATDGHRLSYIDREMEKSLKLEEGVIVPRKGLNLLRKLAEDAGKGLRLGIGKRELMVVRESDDEEPSLTLFVRLIEGKYPKYSQVIPKNNNRIVSLPRKDLIGALRRADIMAQDRVHPVSFSLSPGHLEISSSNPDLGEVKEDLDADYKGKTFQVGFNARYFLDVLNVLADDKVVLQMGDELSPCVIRSEFDRGFLALIMPMRL